MHRVVVPSQKPDLIALLTSLITCFYFWSVIRETELPRNEKEQMTLPEHSRVEQI